jgi:penicillin-binding protein 1A
MGRDDAKPVGGLQGGTAPARAFHDFMSVAVANRPVEQFETQVPMPDWQLTPEEELYGDQAPDANGLQSMVDENGMPLNTPPAPQQQQQQQMVRPDGTGEPSQEDLDQAFPPQQQQRQPYQPQPYGQRQPNQQQPYGQPRPRPPQPDSTTPPDTSEPRPDTA